MYGGAPAEEDYNNAYGAFPGAGGLNTNSAGSNSFNPASGFNPASNSNSTPNQYHQNSNINNPNQYLQHSHSSQYPQAHAQAQTQNSGFDNVDISSATPFDKVNEFVSVSNRNFQNFLDSTTPHTGPRWFIFAFLLFVFMLRVVFYQGFFVVAYALGIYLLNIFLLFLSPKFDPSGSEDGSGLDNSAYLDSTDDSGLPSNLSGTPLLDEFRPFIRRLPEFKFWFNAITAVIFSLFCTIFPFLDIPVFWPILLMYFVLLFALTMRRQIQHMVKYKYLPFDLGKKAYA